MLTLFVICDVIRFLVTRNVKKSPKKWDFSRMMWVMIILKVLQSGSHLPKVVFLGSMKALDKW